MVNVLASSAVDRGFEPRWGQTKRQFQFSRKSEYPEKTIDLQLVTDKLYHATLYPVHLDQYGKNLTDNFSGDRHVHWLNRDLNLTAHYAMRSRKLKPRFSYGNIFRIDFRWRLSLHTFIRKYVSYFARLSEVYSTESNQLRKREKKYFRTCLVYLFYSWNENRYINLKHIIQFSI
jgi:hypothetical protein